MTFRLYTETLPSLHLQGMKNAIFKKMVEIIPPAYFEKQKSISVSKLIEKVLPCLDGFAGTVPPDWWLKMPETPKQFGLRMHQLLHDAFLLLRKEKDFLTNHCIGMDRENTASVLFAFLYKELILPAIANAPDDSGKEVILRTGLGLKEWIAHLSEILSSYPKEKPFNAPLFFIAAELPAQASIKIAMPEYHLHFVLNGQMDAVIYDYLQERFYLYEYKTGKQGNYMAAVLQCVFYHELIRQHCGENLNADAVLAFFSPSETCKNESAIPVVKNNLESISAKPQPEEKDSLPTCEPAEEEANQLITKSVESLQAYGLTVSPKGYLIGPRFMQLRIFPEGKTTVNQISNRSEDLRVKMNLAYTPRIITGQGFVAIEVERNEPEVILLSDQRFSALAENQDHKCVFPLGVDVNGNVHWADLADSNTAHLLVGGTTGSGKSAFLLSVIQFLQNTHKPEHLRLILIDPKQVTYTRFEQSPYLLKPVVKSRQLAIEALEMLVAEMDSRYAKFSKHKVSSITEWNASHPDNLMPRWIIIFDEYADYMMDKSFKDAIESSIERLGFMARAAGIHLIIALQRPDAKTVSSRIKSNLPGRIAFRVASQVESRIILDESGAEELFGKGDMLVKTGPHLERIQAPFLP